MNALANRWPTLFLQLLLLAGCGWSLYLFGTNFPYPSPLVKSFLGPHERWPTAQVKEWILSGHMDKGFYDFFMRDPDRQIPPGKNVIAPADGPVAHIIHAPHWTFIDIHLSFWDVHVQRAPITGTVVSVDDAGDQFLKGGVRRDIYTREYGAPVQKIVTIQGALGTVKIRLITSFWTRRIRVWVQPGQHVDKGQRIGRIVFGSIVVLQLPPDIPLGIEPGDRMTAGETIVSTGAKP
ncbi:MAG TPA: phosphatidylserine decarboxylase [Gammaproteobacteria bacterium]|nr:phosphatidylserine decarboxylase [Gammaproteobacteria bacterium]